MARGGIGRPSKPAKIAEMEGYRKDRIVQNTPVPSEVKIEPPDELSAAAIAHWVRLAPDMIAKGALTAWDINAFGHLCDAIARLWEASEHLSEEGMVIEIPNVSRSTGKMLPPTMKLNPWMQVYKEMSQTVARFAARFGLTPTDRAALSIDGNAGTKNPGADLLSG